MSTFTPPVTAITPQSSPNDSVLFLQLPYDVFAEAFKLLTIPDLLAISKTCRRLWIYTFRTPTIWSRLDLGRYPLSADVFVARALDLDLHITCKEQLPIEWHDNRCKEAQAKLKSLLPRVKSLDVLAGEYVRCMFQRSFLQEPIPKLEVLSIKGYQVEELPFSLFGGQLPPLRSVSISQMRLSWNHPILQNLHHLSLSNIQGYDYSHAGGFSFQDMSSVIKSCPRLETLELIHALQSPWQPGTEMVEPHKAPSIPVHLRTLRLESFTNITPFIASFQPSPRLTEITISETYFDLWISENNIIPLFSLMSQFVSLRIEVDPTNNRSWGAGTTYFNSMAYAIVLTGYTDSGTRFQLRSQSGGINLFGRLCDRYTPVSNTIGQPGYYMSPNFVDAANRMPRVKFPIPWSNLKQLTLVGVVDEFHKEFMSILEGCTNISILVISALTLQVGTYEVNQQNRRPPWSGNLIQEGLNIKSYCPRLQELWVSADYINFETVAECLEFREVIANSGMIKMRSMRKVRLESRKTWEETVFPLEPWQTEVSTTAVTKLCQMDDVAWGANVEELEKLLASPFDPSIKDFRLASLRFPALP